MCWVVGLVTTIVLFVALIFVTGFGVAGYYDSQKDECTVYKCEPFEIYGNKGVHIWISLTKFDENKVYPMSNVYDDITIKNCSDVKSKVECYYYKKDHFVSNIRQINPDYYFMIIAIVIVGVGGGMLTWGCGVCCGDNC